MILAKIGFRIRSDFPDLLSRISYALYASHFLDQFKSKFLHIFFPALAENRRQSYVVKRSTSFIILLVGVLVACEMVSTYLKVPLSSTLAFGGVGGLALGLSARDIAANFLGGLLLLFNEPFVPGDMVTFRSGGGEVVGRVERVGWGQTRIRGRDTRPTYIPNSAFVNTAVTNMERITHRKFEAVVPIRFQDDNAMHELLGKIKEAIRTIPKLDVLSMPFRVHFVKFGAYSLEIEIVCYFATKSIDEFMGLQQTANMEIIKAIRDCGAQLALPTTQVAWTGVGGIASQLTEDGVASLSTAAYSSNVNKASTQTLQPQPRVAIKPSSPSSAGTLMSSTTGLTVASPPAALSLPPLVASSSSSSSSSTSSSSSSTSSLPSSALAAGSSTSNPPISIIQQKARAAVAAVTATMQSTTALKTPQSPASTSPITDTSTSISVNQSTLVKNFEQQPPTGKSINTGTTTTLGTSVASSSPQSTPPSTSSLSYSSKSYSPFPQPRKQVVVVGDETVANALNVGKAQTSSTTSPSLTTTQSIISNTASATTANTGTTTTTAAQPQQPVAKKLPAIPLPDTSFSELWNPIPERDIFGNDDPQPF